MSLHRFYLAPGEWLVDGPALDPADSHHCADVLRLGVGDRLTVFDGEGNAAEAELREVHRRRCILRIGAARRTPPLRCAVTLAQAVPKGKAMDLVLQKAVELGASSVIPLLTERTVVRFEDAGEADRKRERWQAIALEACKQCGRDAIPSIAFPRTVKEFLEDIPPGGILLLASLQPGARPIKEVLASCGSRDRVTVMVGPEGDFTPEEVDAAVSAGAVPVTLGPMVLRTETAALYCLSVLGHELF